MEVAAELGAKAVLSSIWGGERDYIEKFGEICDLAKPFGLTVDLEYVPIAAVASLAQAVDVLRAVNRSNAGLMVDMHHFHRARDDAADLDAVPREWFHFAQLCDAPAEIPSERAEMIRIMREARMYVGEGGIDVASILAHIPRCVYSIELPNKERHEEIGGASTATRCLDAEGVPRRAFRGQERARQAPFRTCNFCQPANRRSVLNETTSDCDTQGVPAPLRIRGCLTATLSSVIRSRIRSHRLSTRGSRATDQDIEYTAIEGPLDGFAAAVHAFRRAGGRGMNVTAPFKLQAYGLATDKLERARLAEATNALKFEGDRIYADNFDGIGFVNDVKRNLGFPLQSKRVLLLGAGGAAHGVLQPMLDERPAQIVIANRNVDRALEMASHFNDGRVAACSYGELGRTLRPRDQRHVGQHARRNSASAGRGLR